MHVSIKKELYKVYLSYMVIFIFLGLLMLASSRIKSSVIQ